MAISVTCPSCQYSSKVPQEHAGKEVICPQCGNTLKVPTNPVATAVAVNPLPAAEIPCPQCSRMVKAGSPTCLWCGMPLNRPQTEVTELLHRKTAVQDATWADSEASRTCPWCAETIKAAAKKCPYCNELLDQRPERQSPVVNAAADLERKARDAFIISLFGLFIFCFGFILGPIAIIQGIQVNKEFHRNGLPSNGLATASIVLGILDVFGFITFLVLSNAR